ncbi:hypothetical protein [Dyadobacter aurulentus]|uniref:hypothetical protein n=1 Tax=Dyadobacter sp. UC 10 TaxID=2605428 RepID=UPI0011F35C3E|nr:hypothetical protein [Dyadobacter sp. UC 10]KAA0990149.1 hypothetical protein FXO21_08250 [Dyadobacter sp. UC 10]
MAISNYNERSRLEESALKFRIARQLSPELTARVNSIYYKDPDRAELETQKREAHELTVKEVEELLNQREDGAEQARELLNKLKRDCKSLSLLT